jgi:uncharacterized LabA/DUF88 family protein
VILRIIEFDFKVLFSIIKLDWRFTRGKNKRSKESAFFMENFAFIDSQNVYRAICEQKWKIDYSKFRNYLHSKFQVKNAYYFIGYVSTNQSLYTVLQEAGFILVFKPTLDINGKIKGNVDTELVLKAMIEYENYQKAVIVSGDGDFYCLIEYLEKNDKLEKIIVPDINGYSSLLRKYSGYIMGMNDLREKLEYKKRQASPRD